MSMEPTREQLGQLAKMISLTAGDELDCVEIMNGLPKLIELSAQGVAIPPELGKVKQHLDVCPPCQEEFDAIVELVRQPDPGEEG